MQPSIFFVAQCTCGEFLRVPTQPFVCVDPQPLQGVPSPTGPSVPSRAGPPPVSLDLTMADSGMAGRPRILSPSRSDSRAFVSRHDGSTYLIH